VWCPVRILNLRAAVLTGYHPRSVLKHEEIGFLLASSWEKKVDLSLRKNLCRRCTQTGSEGHKFSSIHFTKKVPPCTHKTADDDGHDVATPGDHSSYLIRYHHSLITTGDQLSSRGSNPSHANLVGCVMTWLSVFI
jgi:hypothetical protein